MHHFLRSYLVLALFTTGCSDDDAGTTTAAISGAATYRDAMTDHAGAQRAPASPPAQQSQLAVTVRGTGTIPEVDPQCLQDPVGRFEARYAGSLAIADDGAYLAALGQGTITTPSGCAVPELAAGVVTDIVVRAELQATTPNCETYCAASARADAEATCGASTSAASCRAAAETDATAACMTECTAQTSTIVAEVTLGAGTLGELDAAALRAAAFADLEATLVFDALE